LTGWRILGDAGAWYIVEGLGTKALTDAIVSFWVKSNVGTDQTFRFMLGGSRVSGDLTATSTWQRFFYHHDSPGTTLTGITRDVAGTAADLLVWHPQAEISVGRVSPEIPSEYIPTTATPVTKVFRTTNENTVTDNVVTEVPGHPLVPQPMLATKGFAEEGMTTPVSYTPKFPLANHSDTNGPYTGEFKYSGQDSKVLGEFLSVEAGFDTELVVNGTFDTDLSDWHADNGASAVWNTTGTVTFTDNGQTWGLFQLRIISTFIAHEKYLFSFDVIDAISGSLSYQIGDGVNTLGSIVVSSPGSYSTVITIVRDEVSLIIDIIHSGTGVNSAEIDNVSLKGQSTTEKVLKLTDTSTTITHPTALTPGEHSYGVAFAQELGDNTLSPPNACAQDGWTCGVNVLMSAGVINFDNTTSGITAYQTGDMLSDTPYQFDFEIESISAGTCEFSIWGEQDSTYTVPGVYSVQLTYAGSFPRPRFRILGAGSIVIKNITMREVSGTMSLNLDGTWATDSPYDGTLPVGATLDQGITSREIKRFGLDTLQEQKDKVIDIFNGQALSYRADSTMITADNTSIRVTTEGRVL